MQSIAWWYAEHKFWYVGESDKGKSFVLTLSGWLTADMITPLGPPSGNLAEIKQIFWRILDHIKTVWLTFDSITLLEPTPKVPPDNLKPHKNAPES